MQKSLDVQLNLNVRGLGCSATLAINQLCRERELRGEQVYKLGLGQSPFPVPLSVVEALQANAWRKGYLDVHGLLELREAVAGYHNRRHGLSSAAQDVLVGPGSKELMFLLQLVYYGEVLIPTPAWVSYAPQASIIGRRIHFLHTTFEEGWRLTPERLERACQEDPGRPRLLVLNYPDNPTGMTYTSDELRSLAETARRFGVLVLSDEIYGELHFQGRHVSIARFYPEGTILSSGLSKWCGAGGWRLGTFTYPRDLAWLRQAMAAAASETYTTTSAPVQWAAVTAFEVGADIERYLSVSRAFLRLLAEQVQQRLVRAGARVTPCQGGFYSFPDFADRRSALAARGITTSPELCTSLLQQTGVATLPGRDFGRSPEELSLRLAFVDFNGTWALAQSDLEVTRVDEAFVREHAGRVLTALDRLVDWMG